MPTEFPIRRSEKLQPQMLTHSSPPHLTFVVEQPYTTSTGQISGENRQVCRKRKMAFIRRKGNSYYLVHNVRRGGKVRQLHLARLGERARITDAVVREVTKKHPFVELNWRSLSQPRPEPCGKLPIREEFITAADHRAPGASPTARPGQLGRCLSWPWFRVPGAGHMRLRRMRLLNFVHLVGGGEPAEPL